jgi:hypothetical protein
MTPKIQVVIEYIPGSKREFCIREYGGVRCVRQDEEFIRCSDERLKHFSDMAAAKRYARNNNMEVADRYPHEPEKKKK